MRERIHRSIRILALLLAMALTAAGCAGVGQPATETDAVVPTAMEEAEKLTVEVQDASASGNTAEFRLKVTANELDTVLYDNGMAHLKNYRFGDETAIFSRMTFGEQPCLISHRYFYADEDESLAPNQFLLWVRILCRDDIDTELFTIPLTDFGFFDSATGMLVPLYKGVWQVKVPLNLTADPPRRLDLGSRLAFEGQELTIESIELTPLACTVVLHCGRTRTCPRSWTGAGTPR